MIEVPTEEKPRDRRAFNAYRHGLTGHVMVIPPSEQAAYRRHCDGIHSSLEPAGEFESSLAQAIADDRWRLQRAAAIESNIFALALDPAGVVDTGHEEADIALSMARVWLANGKSLERLTLYESRLQRKVEKNLALLRDLQQERRQPVVADRSAAAVPPSPRSHNPRRDNLIFQDSSRRPRPVAVPSAKPAASPAAAPSAWPPTSTSRQ